MNIKSFISNIFSSQKKDRKGIQSDAPLTPLAPKNQTNDEYLLSNLRKSKLFLDDMEIGSYPREIDQNQAVSEAEKYVGVIPSTSQENLVSKRDSKIQLRESLTNSARKRLSAETISGFFERTNSAADNAFIAEVKTRANGGFFNQSENLSDKQGKVFGSQNGDSNPQKLMTALTFGEDLSINRSGNDSSKMPEEHEISQDEQSEKGFFQNSSQSSNSSTNLKRSSSVSSRVRGSSSKKKSITLAESVQVEKILRANRVPDLQVNEDVEGENDQQTTGAAAAVNPIHLQPPQSPSCIERQDSQEMGILTSSQKERQMECFSTRAEPPTQAKHRQNSFFFDASAEKLQLSEYNQGTRAVSSQHSSASSKQSMSIESSSSSKKLSGCSNNVSAFNKEQLPQESRSAGSSPGRASLHALHKQIDMMIDKSEIPPPHLIRSNHKVPSPIKEVDELSQIHGNKHSQKDSVKQKLTLDEFNSSNGLIERQPIPESEEDGSPKIRQKSVKFENTRDVISPSSGNRKKSGNDIEGDDVEDDCEDLSEIDQPKHHNLKLQSRKPTPYNPAKQTPQSYLSRLNKFHPQEPLDISRPLFPKGQECEDVESDGNIQKEVNSFSNNSNSSSSRNKVISQSKTVMTGERSNEQGFNNIFAQKTAKQPNPPLNMQTKKPVKLPLAIKPKDVVNSQIKTNNSNHKSNISAVNHSTPFFRSDPSHSTPLPVSTQAKAKTASGKTSHGTGENSNNYSNSSINRKRKMTSEEESQAGFARKIKIASEHSLSVPKKASTADGNYHGNITSSFGPKSVYKTCVFCENDIKPKEETKTFACCHKAHKTCMAKEKNSVCAKCNSTQVNKLKSNQH